MTRNPTLAVVVLALLALAPIAEGQDRDAPPDAGREIFKPGPIPSSGEPVTEDTLLAPDDVLQAQWRGQWWAARVLDALPDGQVEIHYIGWPSNFDEALPRIRLQIDPDAERMVVRNTFAPSRELSMRPLPAYRIGPPDILQIEIIPKGEGTARHQPSSCTNQRKQSSSVKTEADNIGLNKTGVGVLTLRGENIYTGTTTITDMGGLPNASVGTLKISGYACPIDEAKN
jgi:autotransporter-associated beta strand protein